MFFFEGFVVMFVTAAPLSFLLLWNRRNLKLPKYIFALALATLFASVVVFIGLVGVMFDI